MKPLGKHHCLAVEGLIVELFQAAGFEFREDVQEVSAQHVFGGQSAVYLQPATPAGHDHLTIRCEDAPVGDLVQATQDRFRQIGRLFLSRIHHIAPRRP